MISPISAATIAAIKTAAADKSFAFLIVSRYSLVIESPSFSIAVLNNSAIKTNPIKKMTMIHSDREIESQMPNPIATMAMNKWIKALCSF